MRLLVATTLLAGASASRAATKPLEKASLGASNPNSLGSNPPTWPESVLVFDESDADIQAKIDAIYATNGGYDPVNNGQFVQNRYALMFKPGTYSENVPVGYYTQVLGLGDSPDDVVFSGSKGVYCETGSPDFTIGSLNNFWRSAENFKSEASEPWWSGVSGMLWAVSQASPIRRIHVTTQMLLYQYVGGDAACFASGGFMANAKVDGQVASGSQQQWFTRNSEVSTWMDGVWNMVFTGVVGAPASHCASQDGLYPYTTVDSTPTVAEKPYITIDDAGLYYLNIPAPKTDSSGVEWELNGEKVSFDSVYVADNTTDTADSINLALASGYHVVMAPGIFQLDSPLQVVYDNQVILGLGLATLVSANGNAVVEVADVDGARVAGLLLEAGPYETEVLLQWGTGSGYGGDASNPGVMSDIFARVGGPEEYETYAETMVKVTQGNVVGDNLWLWRADHDVQGLVMDSANPAKHGLVVDADDVAMYGLAVEHTLNDLVQWNGNGGQTYFFQAELPYDVTQANWGDMGYVGYRVNDTVTEHNAYGAGVYHYFRDNAVTTAKGISAPTALESSFVAPFGVFLNGLGTMTHILNEEGDATSPTEPTSDAGAHVDWVC